LLTCKKSSSTGVSLSKKETKTLSLPFSLSILSMVPIKSEKGPLVILTTSPMLKVLWNWGLSSATVFRILLTSC